MAPNLFDKIPASDTQLSAALQKVRTQAVPHNSDGADKLWILATDGTLEWNLDNYSGKAPFSSGGKGVGVYYGTCITILKDSEIGFFDLTVKEDGVTLILRDSNNQNAVLTYPGSGAEDGIVGSYKGNWKKSA
ncbi:hypothetical protein POSPLADRAFT_1062193 [Postia placenta MAD-698-R-SB12]|uniref:Uncharacterized protein n=1 Tax=Postia placenta MAD-698-R-SB12 TaxID=670580 RepID=A0A1X6MLF0_9APHY|nr:hypothetical protein POSPLADRAFT_1062193 [Postia placenta MAD-698-R-SB12]OSX57046.1 hypothetical protein POSPLADRAFT_1062193 [Postia placenta MAD-698-R-SB12]